MKYSRTETDVAPETDVARDVVRGALESAESFDDPSMQSAEHRRVVLAALDSIEAENERLRQVLREIAESDASVLADQVREIGTQYEWARNLARAALATPEETKEAGK